jgi:uncharacterized membrane protein YjjB (DUF3815 family)
MDSIMMVKSLSIQALIPIYTQILPMVSIVTVLAAVVPGLGLIKAMRVVNVDTLTNNLTQILPMVSIATVLAAVVIMAMKIVNVDTLTNNLTLLSCLKQ